MRQFLQDMVVLVAIVVAVILLSLFVFGAANAQAHNGSPPIDTDVIQIKATASGRVGNIAMLVINPSVLQVCVSARNPLHRSAETNLGCFVPNMGAQSFTFGGSPDAQYNVFIGDEYRLHVTRMSGVKRTSDWIPLRFEQQLPVFVVN